MIGLTRLFALLALTTPLCARDTVGAGFGADIERALPGYTAYAGYATVSNGDRIVYDGSLVWREQADGTFLHTIAGPPVTGYPSFIEVDPTETFAVFGESSNGSIYRVELAGGLMLLGTIDLNYAFAFEPGAATGIVSAAVCSSSCSNALHRMDVATGARTTLATIAGPSGPVAFSPAGDLYYATQSNDFPTPPGFVQILRWSSTQLANGPFPLTASGATVFASGLDGGDSMAFGPQFGHLFLAVSPYGNTSNVLELDRSGSVVGSIASSSDSISDIEVFDAPGDGVLAAFQPAGARIQYRATDFGLATARVVGLSPRRPVLTSVQNGNGTMTVSLTGATPNTSAFVISSPTTFYAPVESAHDLVNYVFWTGMPYPTHIRRLGNQITTDATGSGSFSFPNPASIQGTRVIQVLVRDASGTLRGSSNAITN